MAGNEEFQLKLKAGIEAAKRGDKIAARRLLEQVIAVDDRSEAAWIWLASCVNTLSERRTCLEKVLEINPNNARAREALAKLTEESRRASRPAETSASQMVDQLRRFDQRPAAPPPPSLQTAAQSGGGSTTLIALAVLLVIGVLAVGFVGSSLISQQQPPTPTFVIIAATATETDIPPSPTFYIVDVRTPIGPTLPPTFTPTPTETPTPTFTPSRTPVPLVDFPMLYTSLNIGDTAPSLYRMNADGSRQSFVAANVRQIAFDPSANKVAFVRDVPYEADERSFEAGVAPEIFVAPAGDLEAAVQITDLRAPQTGSPSWAPDGVRIVFSSDYDGDEELWMMTDDGQNIQQLTNNENVIDREPAWSPDGKTIIYASDLDSPGLTEIYSLTLPDSVGGSPQIRRMTDDVGSSYSPKWSQDGTKIVFISDRGGDGDVYVMDSSGQRPFLLTVDDGDSEDRQPAFSPDGRWIAFISNREDDRFQIYLINIQGTELIRLTNNEREDQSLTFRPNLLLNVQ